MSHTCSKDMGSYSGGLSRQRKLTLHATVSTFSNLILLMRIIFSEIACTPRLSFKHNSEFTDLSSLVIRSRYYNNYVCSWHQWGHVAHNLGSGPIFRTISLTLNAVAHWRPRPASLRSCLIRFCLCCSSITIDQQLLSSTPEKRKFMRIVAKCLRKG